MDLSACLSLRHQIGSRQRYQIRSANPLNWRALDQSLANNLTGNSWQWRINPQAASVVINYFPIPGQGAASAATVRQVAQQALVASLKALGAQPPAPEVVVIRLRSPLLIRLENLIHLATNLSSAALSLALVLLCLPLLLAGILGLALPLAPGIPLLLLVFLLVEAAIWLRRPFVNAYP
jgi:hypothetical protein